MLAVPIVPTATLVEGVLQSFVDDSTKKLTAQVNHSTSLPLAKPQRSPIDSFPFSMPTGLRRFPDVVRSKSSASRIDIVAVHDLGEDFLDTWTHARSGANWLRDFVPQHIATARVLAFSYDASTSSFFGPDGSGYLQRTAETFIQELYADRKWAGTLSRPIIFVCHGLGGVIVKKALAYSSTRVASKVNHLFDIFVSTFAIMFFGTPQDHAVISNWEKTSLASTQISRHNCYDSVTSAPEESQNVCFFHSVNSEFAPHMNAFHLFFFWEELQTSLGGRDGFVVDHSSAVVSMDNVEKSGIHANHWDMVKFEFTDSSAYRPVIEALSRYCQKSERIIAHRWSQARVRLDQLRLGEVYELGSALTFDIHADPELSLQEIDQRPLTPAHFYPPVEAADDFIGRESVLAALGDTFFPNGHPLDTLQKKSLIVFGMGGSGKTQLCAKYAQDYQSRYTSIFTIFAASPKTIEDSFCKIAMIGGLHPTENAGRHFLSQQKGPWLLIIDNADDPFLDLDALFPKSTSVHVLVTTKNPKFRRKGTLGSRELKGLTRGEALRLLLTRAEIPEPWDPPTEEEGDMVAKSLGYLALALIHAGNCICQQICTLGNYLSLHSASRSNLRRRSLSPARPMAKVQDEEDLVGAVYSTFDLSFEGLQSKRSVSAQDAIEILKVSAFFHLEQIPESIFTRAITNRRKARAQGSTNLVTQWLLYFRLVDPPVQLPQLLMGCGDDLSETRVTWALDELQSLSLISRDAKRASFSMHPLVHQWAQDRLAGSERKIWVSISLNTILESVSLQLGGGGGAGERDAKEEGHFYQDMLPHLDVCLHEHGSPISASTACVSRLSILLSLLWQPTLTQIVRAELLKAGKCAAIFGERGQFERAATYLGEVKDTLVRLQGLHSEHTMLVMHYLSNLYWGLGRLQESIELLNRVVEVRTHSSGPDHEKTLVAMSSLGRAYWMHGNHVESLATLEATTEKMRATLTPAHPETLAALDNYGVTLGSWERFEESREIHELVVASREKSLGSKHPDTLSSKMNLAMALLDLRRLEEAEDLMVFVHEQREQQLGREHPWTLWAYCNLAKVYIEKQSYDKAVSMLVWGVEAGARSLHKDHLGVLMGRGCLAIAYARRGCLDQAEKITIETFAALLRSRGAAHPDTVYCQWKLALLHQRQNRIVDAIQRCEGALESVDSRITRKHPLAKKLNELLTELNSTPTTSTADSKEQQDVVNEGITTLRRRKQHPGTW